MATLSTVWIKTSMITGTPKWRVTPTWSSTEHQVSRLTPTCASMGTDSDLPKTPALISKPVLTLRRIPLSLSSPSLSSLAFSMAVHLQSKKSGLLHSQSTSILLYCSTFFPQFSHTNSVSSSAIFLPQVGQRLGKLSII